MITGIRSDASGTFGALTFGGADAVTFDATGIKAGSYKTGSIVAADFADGALIENAPAGLGYGPGAGGTVTQSTSKSTAVTLNKPTGQITMNGASLAAGAIVTFLVNSSLVGTNDVPSVAIVGGITNSADYRCWVGFSGAGVFSVNLENRSGSPLAQAVVIQFVLGKGAVA